MDRLRNIPFSVDSKFTQLQSQLFANMFGPKLRQNWHIRIRWKMTDSDRITPEYVLSLEQPAQGYLCEQEANRYGVEFLRFEIKDFDSGRAVYQVIACSGRATTAFFWSFSSD